MINKQNKNVDRGAIRAISPINWKKHTKVLHIQGAVIL